MIMSCCMCLEMPRTVVVMSQCEDCLDCGTSSSNPQDAIWGLVPLQCMGWAGHGRRVCTKGAGAPMLMSHCMCWIFHLNIGKIPL